MEKNHIQNNRNWRKNNPLKVRAHIAVNNAIRSGRMAKPTKCCKCGVVSSELQAHHNDYEKPLEVTWLCSCCHSSLHKQKRRERGQTPKQYIKKGYNDYRGKNQNKKDELFPKAVELRKSGYSYGKISKSIGVSTSQIYKWLNETCYK